MPKLIIHVEEDKFSGGLMSIDMDVPGIYIAAIFAVGITIEEAANLSIKKFHQTIPIKILEDFNIRVIDLHAGDITNLLDGDMKVPDVAVSVIKV